MSKYKWFLLIVSLVVVPEIDTSTSKPPHNQIDGVYCNYVCGHKLFSGDFALCFVVYEAKVNVMVARRPMFKSWRFYPMNTDDYHQLMANPNSVCNRIYEGDRYNGKDRCFSTEDKIPEKPSDNKIVDGDGGFFPTPTDQKSHICNDEGYKRDLAVRMEQAIGKALRRYNSATPKPGVTRHETDVQRMIKIMKEVREIIKMIQGLVHLDHGALPINVTTYTSQEWANVTATLTIIRDDAEKNEQPDLKQLVYTLNKVLPVLNAITITSERKRSLGNSECLSCLINTMPGPIIEVLGQPTKEEKEKGSESTMEEVTGKTARSNVELRNDMKKEAEELSKAISSLENEENQSKPDLKAIREFLEAYDSDVNHSGLASLAALAGNGNYENLENVADFEKLKDYTKDEERNFVTNSRLGNHQSDHIGNEFKNGEYPGEYPSQADGAQPAVLFFPGFPGQAGGAQSPASPFSGAPGKGDSAHSPASYPSLPVKGGDAHSPSSLFPDHPERLGPTHSGNSLFSGNPVKGGGAHSPVSFPGFPVKGGGGAHSSTSKFPNVKGNFDIRSSHEVCQYARKYLCEQPNVMIYTSDSKFCLTSYENKTICNNPSENCFQDINFMLQSVQWY